MQKRFNFPKDTVELYAEKVANRGLCAVAQAESLRYKLLGGLAVRRWVFVNEGGVNEGGRGWTGGRGTQGAWAGQSSVWGAFERGTVLLETSWM